MDGNECIIVFSGHNIAIYLYNNLKRSSLNVAIIPTPAKLSYGCSLSVKFKIEDLSTILSEIKKIRTPPYGIFRVIQNGPHISYKRL